MKGNGQINLLTSTTMQVESVAQYHERPVLAAFAQLSTAVERSAGEAAARLFAIPEIGFSKARSVSLVTWYTDLPGTFRALTTLPPEERAAAEAVLRSRLLALIEAAPPETRRLLALALNLPSQDDILVHGDDIVLIRWGFIGAQGTALADWLPEGFAVTAKVASPKPVSQEEGTQTGAAPSAPPPRSPTPAPEAIASPRPATTEAPGRATAIAGALLGVALLLAAFLGYMLWPGNLTYPALRGLLDEAQAQQALRGSNAATIDEIKRLRAALSTNVCAADPAALRDLGGLPVLPGRVPAPGGQTPADTQPRDPGTPPGPVPPAPSPDAAGRQTEGSLLEKLDRGTVLVIGQTAQGIAMGTGILIAPDRVLTNYHVVQKVTGKISVSNQHTDGRIGARVLAHTPNSDFGNGDFALLGLDRPVDLPRMPFASSVERLDSVVAAGYPSFVMSSDPGFTAAVRGGDTSRLAEVLMAVTRGEITTKQPGRNGITVLAHSATTSPGNSGGPLVDACGRVVGVNTYGRSDSRLSLQLNFALSAPDAVNFLKQNNVDVTPETTPCAPAAASTPAPLPAGGQRPAAVPPAPEQAPSAPQKPNGPENKPPASTRSSTEWPLLDRIERGTVAVSVLDSPVTGIVVRPDRVITQVSGAIPVGGKLTLTSFHIKEPVSALVLARLAINPQSPYSDQLALLGLEHPLDSSPLAFSSAVPAAGAPILRANYTDWRRIFTDVRSPIELEWARGEVIAGRPNGDRGIATISAIAGGHEGAALLDACGRVAGIISGQNEPRHHSRIAIPIREVIAFLKRNGLEIPSDPSPCPRQPMAALPPDGSVYLTAQGERKFSTRGNGQ